MEDAQERVFKINEKNYINNEENDIWQVISPLGDTMLLGWDQITVLSKVEDEDKVREALTKVFEVNKS